MLILILIDVQYSQKAAFSFEKGSNGPNHSSSGSHHLIKKSYPTAKFLMSQNREEYKHKSIKTFNFLIKVFESLRFPFELLEKASENA